MRRIIAICVFILILCNAFLNGHGFGGGTYVKVTSENWARIEDLVEFSDIQSVVSYDFNNKQCHIHKILARARSTTNCYCDISLDEGDFSSDIACSPFQQFYLPEKNCWAPAHSLQVGDVLLTEREGHRPITHIKVLEYSLNLYALKIEHPHTFFVGRHSVLTHNMNLPVGTMYWHMPCAVSAFSLTGGLFTGLMTAASSIAVGAIAASLIYSAVMEHKAKKYDKVEIPKENIFVFAQKQNNTPKSPQGSNNNNNQPQDPNGKKPRFTDKIANIYQLFALNEFGQKLKECSEPLKRLYDNHIRIFQVTKDMIEYGLKEGYLFYLDTLHYDHIEVFSEKGHRCVTVLNIDGSFNLEKYLDAIAKGNNIRRYLK